MINDCSLPSVRIAGDFFVKKFGRFRNYPYLCTVVVGMQGRTREEVPVQPRAPGFFLSGQFSQPIFVEKKVAYIVTNAVREIVTSTISGKNNYILPYRTQSITRLLASSTFAMLLSM